jgi:hypothetical protein
MAAALLPFAIFAADSHEYKVADKLHNGDFVINGMTWRPAKVCSHINKGDKVVFSQGNRNGQCVSATIVKNNEEKPCQLWCDL